MVDYINIYQKAEDIMHHKNSGQAIHQAAITIASERAPSLCLYECIVCVYVHTCYVRVILLFSSCVLVFFNSELRFIPVNQCILHCVLDTELTVTLLRTICQSAQL